MKLKKHKVVLMLPVDLGRVRVEVDYTFMWTTGDVEIAVKKLEPNGRVTVTKMHRPDARTLWSYLIRKSFQIVDMTDSMKPKCQNVWEPGSLVL